MRKTVLAAAFVLVAPTTINSAASAQSSLSSCDDLLAKASRLEAAAADIEETNRMLAADRESSASDTSIANWAERANMGVNAVDATCGANSLTAQNLAVTGLCKAWSGGKFVGETVVAAQEAGRGNYANLAKASCKAALKGNTFNTGDLTGACKGADGFAALAQGDADKGLGDGLTGTADFMAALAARGGAASQATADRFRGYSSMTTAAREAAKSWRTIDQNKAEAANLARLSNSQISSGASKAAQLREQARGLRTQQCDATSGESGKVRDDALSRFKQRLSSKDDSSDGSMLMSVARARSGVIADNNRIESSFHSRATELRRAGNAALMNTFQQNMIRENAENNARIARQNAARAAAARQSNRSSGYDPNFYKPAPSASSSPVICPNGQIDTGNYCGELATTRKGP